MTGQYRYIEPVYNAWRRIAYSAVTWTIMTLVLGYLAAWYISEAMWVSAAVYSLLTFVAGVGTLWNAKEGHWI